MAVDQLAAALTEYWPTCIGSVFWQSSCSFWCMGQQWCFSSFPQPELASPATSRYTWLSSYPMCDPFVTWFLACLSYVDPVYSTCRTWRSVNARCWVLHYVAQPLPSPLENLFIDWNLFCSLQIVSSQRILWILHNLLFITCRFWIFLDLSLRCPDFPRLCSM